MATVTVDFGKLPYVKNYLLKQGDSLSEPWHLKIKTEAATTYSDFNLTGCTLTLWVKKGSTTVISGTAITPDTASEGKFTNLIAAATTDSWSGEYIYEIQLVAPVGNSYFPSGITKTVIEGRIKVRTDI